MESKEIIQAAAEAAREKQAVSPIVLDLRGLSTVADYFFVCSGTNPRQVKAIAEEIEAVLARGKVFPLRTEGLPESSWLVLDYGPVLVHVFLDEARGYYSLETLWGDAPREDL